MKIQSLITLFYLCTMLMCSPQAYSMEDNCAHQQKERGSFSSIIINSNSLKTHLDAKEQEKFQTSLNTIHALINDLTSTPDFPSANINKILSNIKQFSFMYFYYQDLISQQAMSRDTILNKAISIYSQVASQIPNKASLSFKTTVMGRLNLELFQPVDANFYNIFNEPLAITDQLKMTPLVIESADNVFPTLTERNESLLKRFFPPSSKGIDTFTNEFKKFLEEQYNPQSQFFFYFTTPWQNLVDLVEQISSFKTSHPTAYQKLGIKLLNCLVRSNCYIARINNYFNNQIYLRMELDGIKS